VFRLAVEITSVSAQKQPKDTGHQHRPVIFEIATSGRNTKARAHEKARASDQPRAKDQS
jgi:peptide methionine sulfoxide reductase MsrA